MNAHQTERQQNRTCILCGRKDDDATMTDIKVTRQNILKLYYEVTELRQHAHFQASTLWMPVHTLCLERLGMSTIQRGVTMEQFETTMNETVLKRLEDKLDDIPINSSFGEAWLAILESCPEFRTVTTCII